MESISETQCLKEKGAESEDSYKVLLLRNFPLFLTDKKMKNNQWSLHLTNFYSNKKCFNLLYFLNFCLSKYND
ncbi:unnamed protein product [Blepharisma stoltei]|uniref:Uncharacterized protein n=1 Tax=Blepharisma stoltei TaxID=1481888 RepID=A0AAU9JSM8_9CILI|nr:unnamed protein product [Blepharisma stoltei]